MHTEFTFWCSIFHPLWVDPLGSKSDSATGDLKLAGGSSLWINYPIPHWLQDHLTLQDLVLWRNYWYLVLHLCSSKGTLPILSGIMFYQQWQFRTANNSRMTLHFSSMEDFLFLSDIYKMEFYHATFPLHSGERSHIWWDFYLLQNKRAFKNRKTPLSIYRKARMNQFLPAQESPPVSPFFILPRKLDVCEIPGKSWIEMCKE